MRAESREVAHTVVAVTGASSGIGAATARPLALDREVRPEGIRVTTTHPPGVHTELAIGAGRTESDPGFEDMRAEDVVHAITIVLRQPRLVRSTQWQLWSMGQSS
ncbi:MAG: hypothetical protein QOI06_3061 [Nocardioidaceae bacterium]|jgi:NADP-dependent 3-hydroxy acid dehydrogenase YdfG|nr:hypothetical protein [Nocardioidaceae bacterium]